MEKIEIKNNKTKNENSGLNFNAVGLAILFVIASFIAEIINFSWLDFGLFPDYILFDVAISLVFAGIICFVPNMKTKIVFFFVFFGLQIILNMVNVVIYNVFGDILSFDMMKLGAEGAAAFSLEFLDFGNIVVNLSYLGLVIYLVVCLVKKVKVFKPLKLKSKIALCLIVFICIQFLGGSLFMVGKQNLDEVNASDELYIAESDVYLWDNLHLKLESFKKFGTWGFYSKSLSNLVVNMFGISNTEKAELEDYLNNGKGYYETGSEAICKDDNLVMVLLESFDWFAIDPYCTPNLYKLRTETGYSLEQYYTRNKTNVSEDISLLGNMPRTYMMNDYLNMVGLETPYSIPNQFKKEDTSNVNFFHGYYGDFYNRYQVNKALGFNKVYAMGDSKIGDKSKVFGDWVNDSEFILSEIKGEEDGVRMIDKMIPDDGNRFMAYITTISTHGPYTMDNSRLNEYYSYYDENYNTISNYLIEQGYNVPARDTSYYDILRDYKCGAMDTDVMIGEILNRLEETGNADNTTLVLFSDHNCYYSDLGNEMKGVEKDDFSNVDIYNVPCLIYSKKIEPKQNYEFCNQYDLYPTICDLFGFEMNSNLVQGYSVFGDSHSSSILVSYLSGIFTNKIYSINIMDTINISNEELTDDDIYKYRLSAVKFFDKQEKIERIYLGNVHI